MKAFMGGKMQLKGNMGLGTKFQPSVFDRTSPSPSGGVSAAPAAAEAAEGGGQGC
jgi:hypothetical protein